MKKKWTKNLTITGLIVGMFLGTTQDKFYGVQSVADFAFLIGAGLPVALCGAIVGLVIDSLWRNNY